MKKLLKQAHKIWANWKVVRTILSAWFDHLKESFSYTVRKFSLNSFVIPPNSVLFLIGRKRVTCRGSKLANSQGKQQHELSTCTWSGRASWNSGKYMSQPPKNKQFLCSFFSTFELGGITKHLMTGPAGNIEFCFPSTSMFPLGPVIKYLLSTCKNQLSWWKRWWHPWNLKSWPVLLGCSSTL